MSAFAGLMVPRRAHAAELSHDERALAWALLIESGHIPLRTMLGTCSREEPNRECAGFLIMPKRPYEWRVHSHGCYKFDNALLGLGPRDQSAHLPVFLHLRTTNLPGPSSVMRSEQAQQRTFERRHNKERMQRRRS